MSTALKKTELQEDLDQKPKLAAVPYNNRILVVDDEPEILQAYRTILSGHNADVVSITSRTSRSSKVAPAQSSPPVAANAKTERFEVVVANSADQALKLVREAASQNRPFAMGFFDVLLGQGMDGIELVKEIRQIDPNIYAVFVTAYNDRNIDSIHQVLGATELWDYLNKPFSEGEIEQKARNAVAFWNLKREKLLQDQRLSEANRQLALSERLMSVATIARGVGHEFGNILMQIVGRAELSRNGTEEQMRSALDTILKATETASTILDRFKSLAKPSEARGDKKLIWANEPIEVALSLMEHYFEKLTIKVCRIKNDRIQTLANDQALVQVYVNLFINAIHAMGNKSGQIDISVRNDRNKFAEIKIRDYGSGIPANIIDKIFEPFFTTKKNHGTGLGLAICREIIEFEHGGHMSVQNHPVKGAEFTIQLPIKAREE